MLPDLDRAERIGEFWGTPRHESSANCLIDLEEDKAARSGHPRIAGGMERK
jgi:hypothetical protein